MAWQGLGVALGVLLGSTSSQWQPGRAPPLTLRGHVNHGDTQAPGGSLFTRLTFGLHAGARILPLRLDHLWERVFSMAQLLPEEAEIALSQYSTLCARGVPWPGAPTRVGSPLPWTCSPSPVKDHSGGWSLRKGLAPHGNTRTGAADLKLLAEVGRG